MIFVCCRFLAECASYDLIQRKGSGFRKGGEIEPRIHFVVFIACVVGLEIEAITMVDFAWCCWLLWCWGSRELNSSQLNPVIWEFRYCAIHIQNRCRENNFKHTWRLTSRLSIICPHTTIYSKQKHCHYIPLVFQKEKNEMLLSSRQNFTYMRPQALSSSLKVRSCQKGYLSYPSEEAIFSVSNAVA